MNLHRSIFRSPIGEMFLVTGDDDKIFALDFSDRRPYLTKGIREYYLIEKFGDYTLIEAPIPKSIALALSRYFEGDFAALQAVLVAEMGMGLQREVWSALCQLAPGQLMSIDELCRFLGYSGPGTAVKVEAAVWENPIAIIVPNHRVISESGDLDRYTWGIPKKRWLLGHENALPSISDSFDLNAASVQATIF